MLSTIDNFWFVVLSMSDITNYISEGDKVILSFLERVRPFCFALRCWTPGGHFRPAPRACPPAARVTLIALLQVDVTEDESSGEYAITLTWKAGNPFFNNATLQRSLKKDEAGQTVVICSDVDWADQVLDCHPTPALQRSVLAARAPHFQTVSEGSQPPWCIPA